jgi:hypothetical protein
MEIIDLLNPDATDVDQIYRRMAQSRSPVESRFGQMMVDFVETLRRGIIGPRLFASKFGGRDTELWLQYRDSRGYRTVITATIDYNDRAPFVDGEPPFHYRLSYTRASTESSARSQRTELRTQDLSTRIQLCS